jgi:hypothetical protein
VNKTCSTCRQNFEITDADLAFYDKVSPVIGGKKQAIPPPTLCPDCRRQRRHSHRNERNLYHRKCDLTGQAMLSAYAPHGGMTVYNHRDWWGDKWDSHSYGKDFDFSRPFFPQFEELMRAVPHMNVAVGNVENSDYCQLVTDCKNCYLVFESSHAEDCLHGFWLQKCVNCCELSFSHECELCYEVDNCYGCNRLLWSRNCTNCSDSAFLLDCIGCKNCLLCVNQRQKEYCILNTQYTKEEYERKKQELNLYSSRSLAAVKARFEEFVLTHPRKYMTSVQAENCTGNYVQESKNCFFCFHAHQAEDCKYGEHVWRGAKDGMDVVTFGRDAELMYETTNTNIGAARDAFCIQCWSSFDVLYSSVCCSSRSCFGCVNMHHATHCILNKQYTKEEYETLVPKIIAHMRKTGEWGEFFPSSISPFSYHESVAQESFPLTKEEALGRGWRWIEETRAKDLYMGPKHDVPDSIHDAADSLSKQIFLCEVTGKPYKIIPQELEFYRDMSIPIPRRSPDQRHADRMRLRNPNQLWDRKCAKCSAALKTTYSPDRSEIILCEKCYLEAVY